MQMKIKKKGKIIIIFYVFLVISVIIFLLDNEMLLDQPRNKSEIGSDLLHSCSYWEFLSSACEWHESRESWVILPSPISELENTRDVFHHKEKAFLIMTDVKNYPKILPKNIVSVNIINQVDNTILAEYELIEHGIRTKLLAEHTMYPYDKHILEIMDGDAKGTKLIQDFTTVNTEKQKWCDESFGECLVWVECECTQITSRMEHKITDVSTESVSGGKSNASAIVMLSNIITSFDEYMDASENETKKIVDDLYREILLRPADAEAFEHWGSLLESEKITNLQLRKAILKSEEAIALKRHNSENIVLVYDVFNMVYEMSGPYLEDGFLIFDPRINQNEFKKMVEKNKHLLDIEEITVDELRTELEQLKENGIDFLVDDLESVQEQFLDWQKRFVDKTHDFCYNCKWGLAMEQ